MECSTGCSTEWFIKCYVQPVLNNSLVVEMGLRAAQLEPAALMSLRKVLLSMLSLSAKPAVHARPA